MSNIVSTLFQGKRKYVVIPLLIFIGYLILVHSMIPQTFGLLRASTLISEVQTLIQYPPEFAVDSKVEPYNITIYSYTYKLRWNFDNDKNERLLFLNSLASTFNGVVDVNNIIGCSSSIIEIWTTDDYIDLRPNPTINYILSEYNDAEKKWCIKFTRLLTSEEESQFDLMVEDWTKGWLGII